MPKTQTTSPVTPRCSPFFTEVVCTLGTTPPHVGASPLSIGGIALHETPTRRRHAPKGLHVVQKSHPFPHVGHQVPTDTRPRCRYARKYSPNAAPPLFNPRQKSPNAAPPTALPRQSSPSKPKDTNFGVFSARWANYFAHRTQPRGDDATAATIAATDAGQHETAITTAHP